MPEINGVIFDEVNEEFIVQGNKPDKPQFKIFWGGRDVDPSLYNRPQSVFCGGTNAKDDKEEMDEMLECIKQGIVVIGVCRGAQLLNVANGGILIQHIQDHAHSHVIGMTMPPLDAEDPPVQFDNIYVTSTHHQAMIPTTKAKILGRSIHHNRPIKGMHWDETNKWIEYPHVNEVVWYPKTKSVCIQPHPEWMAENSKFSEIMNDYLFEPYYGFRVNFPMEEKRPGLQRTWKGIA